MVNSVLFITHPDVVVDPAVPPARWALSARGLGQLRGLLARGTLRGVGAVFSSSERKAVMAAQYVARDLGPQAVCDPDLGEVDRAATGYLPSDEFDRALDELFTCPDQSIRGWERAVDAQQRIVRAMDRCLGSAPAGVDVAIVSHGTVGALLLCALKGVPISRAEMQPRPGHYLCFTREERRLVHGWRPIDHP